MDASLPRPARREFRRGDARVRSSLLSMLLLGTALVELALVWAAFENAVPIVLVAGLHFGLCATLLAFGIKREATAEAREAGGAPHAPWTLDANTVALALWTALTGPAGPVLALLVWLARWTGAGQPAADFDAFLAGDPEDPITRRTAEMESAILDGRLATGPPVGLVPLRDVIESGSQAEVLTALRAASKNFGPDLAPVIRKAAVSEDAAVRVMAATVLANLKKDFGDRIAAARDILDAAPGNAQARRAVFEACTNYARSGLLTDDLASEMRRTALAYAEAPHPVSPADGWSAA